MNRKLTCWKCYNQEKDKLNAKKFLTSESSLALFILINIAIWPKYSYKMMVAHLSLTVLANQIMTFKKFITLYWMSGCCLSLKKELKDLFPSLNLEWLNQCVKFCKKSADKKLQEFHSWFLKTFNQTTLVLNLWLTINFLRLLILY